MVWSPIGRILITFVTRSYKQFFYFWGTIFFTPGSFYFQANRVFAKQQAFNELADESY